MANFLTRMKDRLANAIGMQPSLTEKMTGAGGGKHQQNAGVKLSAAGEAALAKVPQDAVARYAFYAANNRNGLSNPGLVGITQTEVNYYEQPLAVMQIRWDNKQNSLVDRNGVAITPAQARAMCIDQGGNPLK